MKQDDLQKTLEAIAKSGITVNGDLVLEKHVEYEVGNVEDGGIGIQIINGKDASPAKSAPHFPLNKSEEEGKQWYEFLVKGGFIADDTALGCWQYYMGFSVEQPEELRPIAWLKTVETALALKDGATEIDMVLSVGAFLSGDYETVCDEIQQMKETCGEQKLKVILETGCLKTAENIKTASLLAMYSGADYIKTSTGKLEPAATPEAAYVMCQAIKEYYEKTGVQIGFKPAGGLNSVMDALIYYTIVKEVLGEKWLTNQWFRMGTSRLANLLLSEVIGKETKFF